MRFTCDSCGAQYMISDEKVGATGVKVRCKRCSHVILVRSAQPAAPLVDPGPAPTALAIPIPPAGPPSPGDGSELDQELGEAFDTAFGDPAPAPAATPPAEAPAAPAAPAGPSPEHEWFVAIDDAQVGPLLAQGVKGKWEEGAIGPDTLVWRAGLADWTPLSGVVELAQFLAPHPRGAPKAGARPAESAPPRDPAAAERPSEVPPGWKPAAASTLAALATEELASMKRPDFSAAAGPAPATLAEKMQLPEGGVDPTGIVPLTLKGLESTGETLLSGKDGQGKKETTEVRQLRKSTNRRLAVIAMVMVGLFGGTVGALFVYGKLGEATPAPTATPAPVRPPPPAAAPAPVASPAPSAAAPPATAPAATPAPSAAGAPAAPAAGPTPPPAPAPQTAAAPPAAKEPEPAREPEAAAAPAREKPPRSAKATRKAKPEPAARKSRPEKAVAAAPTPRPARKPAGDPLLDLGEDDAASAPGKKSVYVPPAPGSDLPERVSDSQIVEAIVGKKAALQACVEEQKATGADAKGPLLLRWSVAPDGTVQNLKAAPAELARQPITPCITNVVRSLRFPRSKQGRDVESFPFKF